MPIIYKYQAITETSLESLRARKLWAASPSSFNDPFEFRFNGATLLPQAMALRGSRPVPNGQIYPTEERELDRAFSDDLRHQIEQQLRTFSVICYTDEPLNILMWAHYGEQHAGLCLGFEISDETYKGSMHPVRYDTEYPVPSLSLGWHTDGLGRIIRTKSRDWEYEKERRQIFVGEPGLRDYPGRVGRIIFGCRCRAAERQKVLEAVGSGSGITFYVAQPALDSYRLELADA